MEEGTERDALLPEFRPVTFDSGGSPDQTNCPKSRVPDTPSLSSSEDFTCWTTRSDEIPGPPPGDEILCRICQDGGEYEKLQSPCLCSGTVGFVHVSCLNTWLQITSRTTCELCGFSFPVTKKAGRFSEYLRNPRANMDLPNLVCDIACVTVLTPLLCFSMYLTSTGALEYESLGRIGSMCAVVFLLLALVLVYLSWASLAVLYHVRVWRAWRDRNCRVSMLSESQVENPAVSKVIPREFNPEAPTERDARLKPPSSRKSGGARSYTAARDTTIILAPINRLSSWNRVNHCRTGAIASTT